MGSSKRALLLEQEALEEYADACYWQELERRAGYDD